MEKKNDMGTPRSSKLEAPFEDCDGGTENDMRNGYVSRTDWDAVRRMADSDDPIPYDPEDGPYDPNDEAAVNAFWDESERLGLITLGLGKRDAQKTAMKGKN